VHPIERLRMVARVTGEDPGMVAREAAAALAAFSDDPRALVTACRRLVDRQPTSGPVWWLASRVLTAADPGAEAWRAAEELDADPTPGVLAASLPDDAAVVVLGWPEQAADALRRRADVRTLVVDAFGDGSGFAARLDREECDCVLVPESGIGSAVVAADLVLLDASALGPDGFVAVAGSRAAASVAWTAEVPVWVVAGAGRVLPAGLWEAMAGVLAADDEPWEAACDVIPLALAAMVVGPDGAQPAAEAPHRADCAVAPELTGPAGLRGPNAESVDRSR
jgi:hypothetical protein